MTAIQIIGFIIAPLALLAVGWGVALAVNWRARHGAIVFLNKRFGNDRPRKKRVSRTDWAKVDAHVTASEEYDELPELTYDDFKRGQWFIGGKPVTEEEGRAAMAARVAANENVTSTRPSARRHSQHVPDLRGIVPQPGRHDI
jgi:hypothetical protein